MWWTLPSGQPFFAKKRPVGGVARPGGPGETRQVPIHRGESIVPVRPEVVPVELGPQLDEPVDVPLVDGEGDLPDADHGDGA